MRPRIVEFFNFYFHTSIFNYIIPSVTTVYAIMLLAGSILFIRRCRKSHLDTRNALMIIICGSCTGLAGGHFFYLFQNLSFTLNHPAIIFQLNGDSVSFGVYISGIVGIILYCKAKSLPLLNYLDVAASVLGVGPMIGRIACFLNGDDFGVVSNLPWAVQFPRGSYPFIDQVQKGLISSSDALSLAVHPVQLYGSLKGLLLFIVFTILWKKNIFKPGVLFFLFWICYSVCRFVLEIFRADNRGFVGSFSIGHYCSLLIFCFSLSCIYIFYNGKIRINRFSPIAG